jgi:uncharacterized HAD superfamily protein
LRICIDIDGVIAQGLSNWPHYESCEIVDGAVESIRHFQEQGHCIILYTARFEEDRDVTKKWLYYHGIVYDKLIMGKPCADVYIDDQAFKFLNWEDTCEHIKQISKE